MEQERKYRLYRKGLTCHSGGLRNGSALMTEEEVFERIHLNGGNIDDSWEVFEKKSFRPKTEWKIV